MIDVKKYYDLHLKVMKKRWEYPVQTLRWFKKRIANVAKGYISFEEAIETPRTLHWFYREKRRSKRVWHSLLNKTNFYWLNYWKVRRYLKNNNLQRDDIKDNLEMFK